MGNNHGKPTSEKAVQGIKYGHVYVRISGPKDGEIMILYKTNGHYIKETQSRKDKIDPYAWTAMSIDYEYIGAFNETKPNGRPERLRTPV